ncbi:ATP-binding protein [Caballeronia telluris]|uniref:Virulence sensor protein BvgS n=1 Tax=Caballeronia telluris TaxID=326475 RepID=A0A158JT04_9BURK|nr:transporter substrate-binding domain-containing protein [Caballeronia telluris]SAL71956.1 sensor protein evgS [Caballeronia telluris]
MSRFTIEAWRTARFIFCALLLTTPLPATAAAQPGQFVVGAVLGIVPPLELSGPATTLPDPTLPSVVQGVSADYAREVARAMGSALQWRVYPDRAAMIQALARGEIDAATSATGNDTGTPLLLSRPYIPTKQVYVALRMARPSTGRIAYVEAQTAPARILSAYPHATPVGYRDTCAALVAVSLGDADAFVGDFVSTAYTIDHLDLTQLGITNFASFDEGGYSFAFAAARPGAAQLRERVDAALAALPPGFLLEVRARWGATTNSISFDEPIELTEADRAWIATHPVVHYSMLGRAAPLAFRDANGHLAGFAVDILAAIARVTGLRFEARVRDSMGEIDRDLHSGTAALTPFRHAPEKSDGFLRSRPYGEGLLVIVTRVGTAPRRNAEALAGARVAVTANDFVSSIVQRHAPSARRIEVADYNALFEMLASGRADAAVADMGFANYAVANPYRGRLETTGVLSSEPVPYRFVVSSRDPELADIMSRALDHLQPAELDTIRRRWSLGEHPEAVWERRRPQVALGATLGLGGLLLLGAWAVSLRAQIARRIAAEAAMRAAKEEAETANRAKSTFLATMSHEIRTPMSAVLGLIELELRNPGDRASRERSLATAHQAARDLLGLIDDILDVAKMEAERLVLAPAPLELNAWAASVAAIYDQAARSKGVALALENGDVPGSAWVEADALRLRQVVGNLLSNAIKFTAQGRVTLAYRAGEIADGSREVVLAVSDSGIGMTPQQQAKLFAPFVQVHDVRTERFGGTGLGLSICRRLVTMMGGTIEVASEPGRGSRFTVRLVLPAAEPAEQPGAAAGAAAAGSQADAERARLAGLHVLVIDDHLANRIVLGSQLAELGCTVECASDGGAGLSLWQANPASFDLILLDCSMPVMRGEEVARRIRAREAQTKAGGAVPIVGVTADAQAEAAALAIESGMTLCLVKPVGLDDLRSALASIVGSEASRREPAAEPAPTPAPAHREAYDRAAIDAFGAQSASLVDALQEANALDFDLAREAMEACDYARLYETAHRMKGAAVIVGAKPFSEACLALQLACERALDEDRNGEDDEDIAAAFRAFVDAGDALGAALALRVA